MQDDTVEQQPKPDPEEGARHTNNKPAQEKPSVVYLRKLLYRLAGSRTTQYRLGQLNLLRTDFKCFPEAMALAAGIAWDRELSAEDTSRYSRREVKAFLYELGFSKEDRPKLRAKAQRWLAGSRDVAVLLACPQSAWAKRTLSRQHFLEKSCICPICGSQYAEEEGVTYMAKTTKKTVFRCWECCAQFRLVQMVEAILEEPARQVHEYERA